MWPGVRAEYKDHWERLPWRHKRLSKNWRPYRYGFERNVSKTGKVPHVVLTETLREFLAILVITLVALVEIWVVKRDI